MNVFGRHWLRFRILGARSSFAPRRRVVELARGGLATILVTFAVIGCRGRVADVANGQPSSLTSAQPVTSEAAVSASAPSAPAGPLAPPVPSTAPAPEPTIPDFPRGQMADLVVEGFASSVVAYPDVQDLRDVPLVVAFHGNFDRPEWQCETWAVASRRQSLILCPRGQARPDTPASDKRFTYDGYGGMKREFLAALAALRVQHQLPETQRLVLLGFSLGGNMGVELALDKDVPAFAALVLIEGGTGRWDRTKIARFAERGGKGIWFGCGQAGCAQTATRLEARIVKAGMASGVVKTSIGHTYDGQIAQGLAERWSEIVRGASAAEPAEVGK